MIPKAILLDMDDTIISHDHGVDIDRCWKTVCSKHLKLDGEQTDEVIALIKKKAHWYWSDPDRHRIGRLDLDKARTEIVTSALQQADIHDVSVSECIAVEYGMERDHAVELFPGAIETLQYFRNIGLKLTLITNGSSRAQRGKIERFKLAPFFDNIIIEEEFGVGKPDHKVYLLAVKQLSVNPEETWMIGDNYEWEIVSPQKLGIKGVWINHKGVEFPSSVPPFKTITTLSDMMNVLDS